ncbi:SusC/RagA family TonB-linked outer membrane protein [Pedobacter sp. LMG 31464]|uniref:SusC/RagA family TonB-linked outer membrane protein n=1 Tax=Pedobacter planticolens TaxID=2679964 RepID=A0A923DZF7_9SPHI|nr:TonB-dependent receptor [Pedobacter planticolens]MBB2146929.1 SusC/RagA family TonB-linked outer membrane protein [Pedobacter planticolens]
MLNKLSTNLLAILVCLLSITTCFAQDKKISGRIADENGTVLPGVSVSIKNTKVATVTDGNGNFSLNIPATAQTLVITFLGMEEQQLAIGTKTSFNVVLKSKSTTLSDVVIVGYGTVKKSDLTGSVSRIEREDLIKDAPTNVLQALQGKIAGVNVTQNDGAPGAGLSIRVRGSNSFLGGTEPLYVIDGVPFNNNSSGSTPIAIGDDEKQTLNAMSFLNPDDIESIDILKDASATAIYGSRGANGVVLITTRKGKSGKDRVEANFTIGQAEVSRKLDVLNASEYAAFQNLAYANSNKYTGTAYALPYPGAQLPDPLNPGNTYYAKGPQDYVGNNNNWQDQIFRRGLYQNYSVNVSGGSDAGSHSLTFNYLNQEGTISNSDYKRFSLGLNLNRNISKTFKVGTSTSMASTINNGVKTGTDKSDAASAGVIRSALTFPATLSEPLAYDGVGDAFITNPYIYVNDVLNRVKGVNIFTSNYLEATFLKDFKFRQNIGFSYAGSTRDQYYPRSVYEGFAVKGWGLKSDNTWNSGVAESILTYNKKIEKHSLNIVGAGTFERTNGNSKRAEAKTFPNDALENENLAAGEVVLPIITYRYQSTLISFLGRANYSYDDRYLLTFSYRQDGSSKFGKDNKWAGFSSAAAAWKISNEEFMKNVKTISDLKLRISYGQTGNQGIGSYASLAKLSVYNYPFGGSVQTGLANDLYAGPANEKLKWETTTSYNLGLDLGMFKNRLNLHVDLYKKVTDDLLQNLIIPSSTGFQTKLVNSGSIENKGLEVTLNGVVLKNKDFEWNSNFNISFNRNKILSLSPDVTEQYGRNISTGDAPFIQTVGKPIGALYGYVEDGYYDNEAEVRSDPAYSGLGDAIILRTIGEIKYKNLDNDRTSIAQSDRTFIGDVNPDYTFGFTNNFKYKRFDLSVFINGVQGNDIINMNTRFSGNLGTNKNITQEMSDGAWAQGNDNTNATGPKIMRQFFRNLLFSRRFVEDGSFVRIKNITFGYNVPLKSKTISNLKVSLGVNNLYTFTNYSGYDPEINSYGDNPALFGVDLGGYPNSRTYNLSLRCNF